MDSSGALSFVDWLILVIVFFLTSAISMVTGSTSLITVPMLIQVGINAQVAIATNMFALTLMSIGATLPFVGQSKLDIKRSPRLIVLTLVSSSLGAWLLKYLPSSTVSTFIAASMLAVVAFSFVFSNRGVEPAGSAPSRSLAVAGYLATFLLGIYGGLFSGGYVTLLTTVFVGCFGHTFIEAIATSKLINIFSSLVATLVFIYLGLVDYSLGLLLGITMFVGAFWGGKIVLKMPNHWLKGIYLMTVVGLAIKLLYGTLVN